MKPTAEPKLAAPGAGLPRPELLIARFIFWLRRREGRPGATARFLQERAEIAKLIRTCSPEMAATRVLIKRPPGLEDSSRNWSLWMTLDHLRIVHDSIRDAIEHLTSGGVPANAASTATVKPDPAVTAAVPSAYEQSCDALLAAVAAVPNLETALRYAHPWFGPLNAAGWHSLAGMHLGLHRGQIERILAGLRRR